MPECIYIRFSDYKVNPLQIMIGLSGWINQITEKALKTVTFFNIVKNIHGFLIWVAYVNAYINSEIWISYL